MSFIYLPVCPLLIQQKQKDQILVLCPGPHFLFSLLSSAVAVASVFAAVRESEPAVGAIAQGGAVGASLAPGDAVGKAAVAVVVGTDAEAAVPTTFVDESVGDSEEADFEDG